MNRTRKKSNHLVLALVVAAGLAVPVGTMAQGGMFGRGISDESYYSFGAQGPMLNRDGVDATGAFSNQHFGNPIETDDITNQTFGTPLGSGVLIMLAAGAGYLTVKSRKRNKKNNKRRQTK